MPVLSGRSSDDGYCDAVSAPAGSVATTGVTAVNPGAISRLTSLPSRSVMGASYSQRTPRLIVNDGLSLTSSVTYASYELLRKYLSGLPNATELVCGRPSRKSAKSDP